ncbi:MAG: insulinase family protein, partial [Proteobacteria bacterium]|nr:insulinase family protein [Pseudomonadota bacterium]
FGYPVDEDDLDGKTHIVLGWLLGPNTDLEMLLKCHLLSDVLLDTSASPLRHALEKTPLARGASPLCGFEEDHFETSFVCGVEGSEPEHAEAVEQLVLDVLEKVAEEGIDESRLQAVLHQLELSQREIGGDGYPYGLQLIFSCMSAAIHRGDPIGLLNIDPVIEHLKEQIREPDFIRTLVRELLLDNPHRVRVTMKPDRQLGKTLLEEERARLDALRRSLGDDQVEDIKRLAAKLKERQAQEDDLELLPQVTREDIPRQGRFVDAPAVVARSLRVVAAEAGTNGIGYHQLTSSLPPMTLEQLTLLPVYTQVVTEIGSAGRGYLETQHLQHESTGGISAFATVRALPDDASCYRGYLTLSSRTLNPRAEEMVRLVQETALSPDFDEPERLKELVTQLAMRRMNAVAGNGHQYAMSAAAAGLSPVGAINDYLAGIPGIRRLSELAKRLESGADLGTELAQLHGQLRQHDPMALAIADPGHVEPLVSLIDRSWADQVSGETPVGFAVPQDMALPADDQAFVVTTQVNFCASAFPTVAESHDDSAALTVLAGVLRNSFLHTEIREKGGAYGGGAGHDSSNGVFRFYSYRDPRLMQTFATFEQAIDWVQRSTLTDAMLEEAILQIIGSIDSPGSPAGEIRQAFHHGLYGRDAAHRRAMRQRIIDVRPADLKRVASEYLQVAPRRAVVLSENRLGELENSFETVRLN